MANVPVVQPAAETAPVKDPLTLAMEKVRLERAAKQLEGKTQEVANEEKVSADLERTAKFDLPNPFVKIGSDVIKSVGDSALANAAPVMGGMAGAMSPIASIVGPVPAAIGGALASKQLQKVMDPGPKGAAVAPAQEALAEHEAIQKRFADAKAFNLARDKELQDMGAPPVPGALEAENRRAEAEYLVDLEEYRKKYNIVDESDLVFSKGGKGAQGQSAQPGKPQLGGQGGQAYGGGAGGGGGGAGGGGGGMGGFEAHLSPEEMALRQRQAEVQLAYDDQYQAQRRAMAQIEAQGAAAQDHAAQRQKMLEDYQHVFNQTAAQIADAPDFSRDAFWANKNTGQTIATVVGTLLQGIGLGLAGKPELAANLIDQKIEQDLMIQKLNYQKRKDVSGAALDAYSQAMRLASNADEADKLAKVSMYDRIAKDIESQATKVKGAESAADFDMMLARLAERREEALLKAQVAMMKRKGGRGGGGGGAVGPGGGGGGGGGGLGAPVGRGGGPGGPELGGFVDPEKVVYTHGKFGVLFNDKTSHDEFSKTNRYVNEARSALKEMIEIGEGIQNGSIPRFDAATRERFNRAKLAAMPPAAQGGGAGVINNHDEKFVGARLGGVGFKDVAVLGFDIPGARFVVNKNAIGQLKEALGHMDNILKNQAEANGGAVVVNTGETYAERAPGGKSGARREVAAPRLVRGVDVSGIDSLANQIERARQPAGAAQPKPEFTVPTDELGR